MHILGLSQAYLKQISRISHANIRKIWGKSQTISGISEVYLRYISGLSWHISEIYQASLKEYLRYLISCISWAYLRYISSKSQEYLRIFSGKSQENLIEISGISEASCSITWRATGHAQDMWGICHQAQPEVLHGPWPSEVQDQVNGLLEEPKRATRPSSLWCGASLGGQD